MVKMTSSLSWHIEFEVLVGYKGEECPERSLRGSGIQQ